MFGIEEDDLISPNISDHFELYFPDEKTILFLLTHGTRIKRRSNNDIYIVGTLPNEKKTSSY
jgi:hypothetical protein